MGNEDSRPTGDENLSSDDVKRRAITKMDLEMRQKMKKGVNYNKVRIIIRGEVNTGKTSLWRRLQGQSFSTEYSSTRTIQVCHIPWNYKITDDVVKVEIWDVVDKAKPKKAATSGKLKLTNEKQASDEEVENGVEVDNFVIPLPNLKDPNSYKEGSHTAHLDATNFNVLQDTHGVIFMMDPRREWTWVYVQKEIPKIPTHIRILVLANYRDADRSSAKVTTGEIKQYCKQVGKHIFFLDASMKDCFGLVGVKTFLNLPFLELQREHLEAALYQNKLEEKSVLAEYAFSANLEYDGWRQKLQLHQDTLPREIISYKRKTTKPNIDPSLIPADMVNPEITPEPEPAPKPKKSDPAPAPATPEQKSTSSKSEKKQPKTTKPKKEEKSEGFLSVLGSVFGKEEAAEEPETGDDVVDDLRKLAQDRKDGILPSAPVEDVTEFAPDAGAEDEGFWSDADDAVAKEEEKSEESSDKGPALLEDEDPSYDEEEEKRKEEEQKRLADEKKKLEEQKKEELAAQMAALNKPKPKPKDPSPSSSAEDSEEAPPPKKTPTATKEIPKATPKSVEATTKAKTRIVHSSDSESLEGNPYVQDDEDDNSDGEPKHRFKKINDSENDDDWSAIVGDSWNAGVEEDPDFLQVKKYPTPGSKNREDAAGIRNIRNLNQQPELASSDPEKPQNPAYASIDDNPAPTRGRGGRGRGGRGRPPRGRAGATAGPPRGKKV